MRSQKCPKPLYEPKKNLNQFDPEDPYLQEKYLELERVLGQQRVPTRKCSVGRYSEEGKIVLEKKAGCWDKFGYSEHGVPYVPLHEALFLVESVWNMAY